MADKTKRAPGIFKKPVKKEKWEKKFLKKLYLPEDRKFLKSLAVEKSGFITINIEGLSKKDVKRLKALGKAIKKNRKGFNFIIILMIILLAGGAAFFHFYLKNKLVQQLIETSLEKIFLADVEAEGVNLAVMAGHFSLDRLAIADASSPMTNLVEFSSIEADLRTSELLQGRVFIEEIGFSGMKRGQPRSTSGLLDIEDEDPSGKDGPVSKENAKSRDALKEAIGQISALSGNIDVKALLEQQKSNLESFSVIEESKQSVEGYSVYWQERAADWNERLSAWDSKAKYIASVNPDSFSTLDGARSTISELESIYKDAEQDLNEVQTDYDAVEKQYNEAVAMTDRIRSSVEADYAYIESLVSLPAGSKVDWAASVLEDQLSMPFTKYLSYLERGLGWYEKLKRFSDSREAEKPERRRDGRSLPPPASAPPGFTLVHAFASGEEPDIAYRFDLYNIVSEPDKWDGEAELEIGLDTPSTGAAVAVITEKGLSLSVPSAPFDLGSSLKQLDVASFSGNLSLDSAVGWADNEYSGNIDLAAAGLVLEAAVSDSLLFRLINTSVESVKPLSASGKFSWSETEGLSLSLDTELDESLGNAAKALIAEGAQEGLEMLKDYLGEELAGPLSDFNSVKADLESRVEQIKNYEAELDKYRKAADDKIAEIENTVKEKIAEMEKAARDEIRRQAEDAVKDVIPEDVIPDKNTLKDLGGKLKF